MEVLKCIINRELEEMKNEQDFMERVVDLTCDMMKKQKVFKRKYYELKNKPFNYLSYSTDRCIIQTMFKDVC